MTAPANFFTVPALFGRFTDVTLVPTRSIREAGQAHGALTQHEYALAVSRELTVRGLRLSWLADTLEENIDQLRRKLHGHVHASIADLAAWAVALNLPPTEIRCPTVTHRPAVNVDWTTAFDAPDVVPLGIDEHDIPHGITLEELKKHMLFSGNVGSGAKTALSTLVESLLEAGWFGVVLDLTGTGFGPETSSDTTGPRNPFPVTDVPEGLPISDMCDVLCAALTNDAYWEEVLRCELDSLARHTDGEVTVTQVAQLLRDYTDPVSSGEEMAIVREVSRGLDTALGWSWSTEVEIERAFSVGSYVECDGSTAAGRLRAALCAARLGRWCEQRAKDNPAPEPAFVAVLGTQDLPAEQLNALLTRARAANVTVLLHYDTLTPLAGEHSFVGQNVSTFVCMRSGSVSDGHIAAQMLGEDAPVEVLRSLRTLETGHAAVYRRVFGRAPTVVVLSMRYSPQM